MIAATEQKSNTTQNDVTEKLGERVQNINYWKFELERGIQGKLTGDFLIKVTIYFTIQCYSTEILCCNISFQTSLPKTI